jgi:hypothetical protein
MKYGRLILMGGILAGLATPMFADTIYGEFDGSGQGAISTATSGLTLGGAVATTGGGNLRPTGTVTDDGTGVFGNFSESQSFFYHFIASVPPGSPSGTKPTAQFDFGSVATAGAAGIEFLQANSDPTLGPVETMKFFITSVGDETANSGSILTGNTGNFDGTGYVTFSNVFVPGTTTLFQEAVQYDVSVNKGAGQKPFTVVIQATQPPQVPEPSSLALLGTGMLSVAGFAFRKRR